MGGFFSIASWDIIDAEPNVVPTKNSGTPPASPTLPVPPPNKTSGGRRHRTYKKRERRGKFKTLK